MSPRPDWLDLAGKLDAAFGAARTKLRDADYRAREFRFREDRVGVALETGADGRLTYRYDLSGAPTGSEPSLTKALWELCGRAGLDDWAKASWFVSWLGRGVSPAGEASALAGLGGPADGVHPLTVAYWMETVPASRPSLPPPIAPYDALFAADSGDWSPRTDAEKWAAVLSPGWRTVPTVFVFGAARGGTTWMREICYQIALAAGLDAYRVDQSLSFLKNRQGQPTETYPLLTWLRHASPYFPTIPESALATLVGDHRCANLIGRRRQRLIAKGDPSFYGDPAEPTRRIPATLTPVPVLRDPRDVAVSRRAFFADGAACERSIKGVENVARWARIAGQAPFRYETALASPLETAMGVGRAMGVALTPDQAARVARGASFKTMSGGREYGQKVDGHLLRGGSDHRTEMPPEERAAIWREFGDRIGALGYQRA